MLEEAEHKVEKAQQVYDLAVRDTAPPLGPPLGPLPDPGPHTSTGAARQPKIDIHLQPDTLTEDSNPTEFMEWMDGLKLWMDMSFLLKAAEATKIGVMKRVITPQLATRCDVDNKRTLTDALATIENDFRERYPTITLRLEYGRMKQKASQKFSDFASELKRMGEMANADAMAPDQYQSMLLINGTTDKELLKKFLEMGKAEFTVQKICAKGKFMNLNKSCWPA